MPESLILTHDEKKELVALWRKLQTNVEEKVTASIVYAIGFAVCLVMWIANFF